MKQLTALSSMAEDLQAADDSIQMPYSKDKIYIVMEYLILLEY